MQRSPQVSALRAVALVATVLAAALAGGGAAGVELVKVGSPPDLFLLYTGDVIGHVDPCG